MNHAKFSDEPGSASVFAKRALKAGALSLLLLFGSTDQTFACYPDSCISVEKFVSVNGLGGPFIRNSVTTLNPTTGFPMASVPGTNDVPAPTVIIPTDFFGDNTKVLYKFVIKNCGSVTLRNVALGDCIDTRSVGATGFLKGPGRQCGTDPYLVNRTVASVLQPGQTVTLTSASFPNDRISTIDVCDAYGRTRTQGIVRNDVLVRAYADKDGDGVGEKACSFEELNLVQCKDHVPALGALGDRVWRDLNENGVQDCADTNNNGIIGDAGDVGNECSVAAIPGVPVSLVDCTTPSNVLASTLTDASGFYLFQNLNPGQYCVRFNPATIPTGVCAAGVVPQLTTQNVGNDAFDSDANPVTGISPAVTVNSGETNRTVDAGVICKGCALAVDKKCQVQVPPTQNFVCSDAKPIDSLTMIWTGQNGIYIKAWKGTVGGTLLATIGPIATGEKVTVTGMGGSPNDQYWEIFSGLPSPINKIGQSVFHISCSDIDMNGPEDCGKLEGNAKTTISSLINLWTFDGMAGRGQVLSCTPATQTGTDACTVVAGSSPSCESLNAKPTTLAFRYTGSDCSASSNNQALDKWFCSGVPGTNPFISVIKDPSRSTVSPTSGFQVGDIITVSAIGSDMGAETELQVGGQYLKIHTSCSQPLAVGDVFGSLELVQFNGQGGGGQITYSYDVKNNGSTPVEVTSVSDDKLGELLTQTTALAAGATLTLEKTAFISQTTTNQVTASARFVGTSAACGQASDQLTVTVTQPTCNVAATFYTLGDDRVKFRVMNNSSILATLDTFVLNFPASYGAIKEIRLDGTIYKAGSYVPVLGSGVTLTNWTNPDVSKRQLDPGESRSLEIIFTNKGMTGWTGITNVGGVTFREGCQSSFPVVPR